MHRRNASCRVLLRALRVLLEVGLTQASFLASRIPQIPAPTHSAGIDVVWHIGSGEKASHGEEHGAGAALEDRREARNLSFVTQRVDRRCGRWSGPVAGANIAAVLLLATPAVDTLLLVGILSASSAKANVSLEKWLS